MSKVWDHVVQELHSYSEYERKQKSFFKRVLNFLTKNTCSGDCRQGRAPCNCGMVGNHDNRY